MTRVLNVTQLNSYIHLVPLHVIINIKYMIYYPVRCCEIRENLFNIKHNHLYT
jgi:hypothetical protein